MIVVDNHSKDIKIPAGLADNAGVIYETAGVTSVNGQTGDVTLKTVNGEELTGSGDIEIKAGVSSLNSEKGDLNIKSINGESLLGEGDITVASKGVKYWDFISGQNEMETYYEVANNWDEEKACYTGDYIFRVKCTDMNTAPNTVIFNEIGYNKEHSVHFSAEYCHDPYDANPHTYECKLVIWYSTDGLFGPSVPSYTSSSRVYSVNGQTGDVTIAVPTKTSELTNDSGYVTEAVQSTEIGTIKVLTQAEYDALEVKDTGTLYCING